MARRKKEPQTWKWSDLSHEMRVMAWWFRNQEDSPDPRRPWGWLILAVVAALACSVLFVLSLRW